MLLSVDQMASMAHALVPETDLYNFVPLSHDLLPVITAERIMEDGQLS